MTLNEVGWYLDLGLVLQLRSKDFANVVYSVRKRESKFEYLHNSPDPLNADNWAAAMRIPETSLPLLYAHWTAQYEITSPYAR